MPDNSVVFRDAAVADAFEQAALQDWLPLEMTQLSAGSYQGQVRTIEHQQVSAIFEHQTRTVHKRGVMPDGLCTVSFFREQNRQQRFSKYKPQDHSLFLLPSGAEFDIHVPEDTSTLYFLLNQSYLLESLRALNPQQWQADQKELLILDMIDRRGLNRLAELLATSHNFVSGEEASQDQAQLGSIMLDQIIVAMSTPLTTPEPTRAEGLELGRARDVVNRFIEYMVAEFQQQRCPSVVDLCVVLHVSQRTLQYSFKKILGITPIAYLRYHRLNQARQHLLNPKHANESVTDIATHWHFLHLSKFSDDYQRMFGELPSQTLRNARANA